jgi:MFS family permease
MGVRMLAQGWLVLEITDSPFWVGAVAGLQGLGLVGFGAFGGTIVDRFDKRMVLAAVHFIGGVIAFFTGALIITDHIELWHMLIIALMQGLLMATQLPASNSLVYQIVGPQRLLNAMATRLMAMNMSRIVGSLAAGVLISQYGVGSSYLFAGFSSIFGLGFLWFVRGSFQASSQREPFLQATGQGLKYIWRNRNIRGLLLLSLLMEAFGFSHLVMMPVMARDVLNVGATGLGYLSAASGIGSTLSTLTVAGLGDFKSKGALLTGTAFCAGVSLVFFAFSPWFAVSLVMVALAGGSLMAYDVTMGTMLQLISLDDMRGRVMGVYGLTFGFTPVGGFFAGSVAAVLSAPIAVAAGGIIITMYIASMFRSMVKINPRA